MSLKIVILNFFLFTITSSLFAQKAVIFELDNVLFSIEENTLIGSLSLLEKWATDHYRDRFLKILFSSSDDTEEENLLRYCEKNLPTIYKRYFLGLINSKQAYKKAIKAIEKNTNYFDPARYISYKAAEFSFIPEKEISLMQPIMSVFEIIETCREKNIKIVVLSNKNIESLALLKEIYPIFFFIFDDVLISHSLQKIKPYAETYVHVVEILNLIPENCLFIESQESYTQKAIEAGFKAFTYKNDERELLKKLQDIKFI